MDRMTRAILFTLVVVGAYGMGLATGMLLGWTGTVAKPAFVHKSEAQKRREIKERIDETNWYTHEAIKMLKDGKQ